MLAEKLQRHFKAHIIYLRLSYYLAAHLILTSNSAKSLLGVFSKLLESQLILLGVPISQK